MACDAGGVRILHISPHPDDEMIGAPATLLALRDAGHQVTNLALSLGRPADHERRRAEVTEACRRAGLGLVIADPPIAMSSGDDTVAAERAVRALIADALDGPDPPGLIIGPCHHDVHHGHELTGRAIRDELSTRPLAPPWWIWAIWGDLPLPTLITTYDDARAEQINDALSAHALEMERADHRVHVDIRGRAMVVMAPEKAFGFGAPALGAPRAEALTEVIRGNGQWLLGTPRVLDPASPLAEPRAISVDAWLAAPSARDLTHLPAPGS